MPSYFTKASLREYARRHPLGVSERVAFTKALTDSCAVKPKVFLSHSSADKEDIDNALSLLGSQGVAVYVDYEDPALPATTSPTTAAMLRRRIEECDGFVLVATQNAAQSAWVPWELGFADKAKSWGRVALVPVADPSGRWVGNEYFGIYQTIQEFLPDIIWIKSLDDTLSVPLGTWLNGLRG